MLTRAPSGVLVVSAIASVQFGSAIAATLFAQIGPAGAVFLRLVFGTIILLALWRPRLHGYTRYQLALACLFGLVLGGMNLSFYSALHRIPLGIAVTLEFVGPLTVALAGSRRPIDLLWVAIAAAGIIALTQGDANHLNALGVGFALLAGALWGTYIIVNARVGQAFEGGTGLALAMCVASVVILPFGIAQGGVASARAALACARGRYRPAVLGDPVLVRGRGAPAHPPVGVRRADEHRAGDGRARRLHRARAGPERPNAPGDGAGRDRLGGSGAP